MRTANHEDGVARKSKQRSTNGISLLYTLRIASIGLVLAAISACAQSSNSPEQTKVEAVQITPEQNQQPPTTVAPVAEPPNAVCVDGGLSGRPFSDVNCIRTVTTISEAADDLGPGSLVVVRAFPSDDANSIRGMGTYRDPGLQDKVLTATVADPIIIQAEGFDPEEDFTKPIIDGALRVSRIWQRTPGTNHTWQIPFDRMSAGLDFVANWSCIDRIWVSRLPGKDEMADFPLTRPIMQQGGISPYYTDCEDNTVRGESIGPAEVDSFPGSYMWLDGILYIHLPGGEDPNQYTVEVPDHHPLSKFDSAAGLIIRGFRVYHSLLGIDLYSCGTSAGDRCEASHNDTSFNFPFGLHTGPYSYLHHNTGILNTLQLIKITQDFSEVSYNVAGPHLSHGFKLLEVRGCTVHHNEVFGNNLPVPEAGTQAGWTIIGTRDITAGIYVNFGTQECEIFDNNVYQNGRGIYIREDEDRHTEGNSIHGNQILDNDIAIKWGGSSTWKNNLSNNNLFSAQAVFQWADNIGPLEVYAQATNLDIDSRVAIESNN